MLKRGDRRTKRGIKWNKPGLLTDHAPTRGLCQEVIQNITDHTPTRGSCEELSIFCRTPTAG